MSEPSNPTVCEVVGVGAASAAPDVVVVEARVQVEAQDVAGALAGCAEAADRALAVARDVSPAPADVQTTGIGISPRWDHQGQQISGHTAFTSFRCVVRDRDLLGPFLSRLADATGDALAIDSVRLQVGKPDELLATAREAAFDDAREKAQHFARLAGRGLGEVLHVSEVPTSGGPMPKMREYAADQFAGSMPVAAGESTVTASVLVRWELTHR
jgi:uncharacterized protein YggE